MSGAEPATADLDRLLEILDQMGIALAAAQAAADRLDEILGGGR